MRIEYTINLNVHLRTSGDSDFQREALNLLRVILAREIQMTATLDQVLADVTEETTAIDSLGTLIAGLKAQIDAAGGNQAKIDQIFANLESNKQKLAAALSANVTPTP